VPKEIPLRPYWFPIAGHLGIGVTATSRAEANKLAAAAAELLGWPFAAVGVIENFDVRELDQNHVVPNMSPMNWWGIWFPRLSAPRDGVELPHNTSLERSRER
jgi:hypothetical protein